MRLLCLPYAGGGAPIFRGWQSAMPAQVGVVPLHLPGRGTKYDMAPIHQWPLLIEHLVSELRATLHQPFAIFGHSMGALVGLELAFAIRDRYGVQPVWFGASGCAAPCVRDSSGSWLDRSDADLLRELCKLKGTPDEVLLEPELLDLLLPRLRADFHLCGTYEYRTRPAIECPVSVFAGNRDEATSDTDSLTPWSRELSGTFSLRRFDGDHFFINTVSTDLASAVGAELRQSLSSESAQFVLEVAR